MKQKEMSLWLRLITVAAAVCCAVLAVYVVPHGLWMYLERNPQSGLGFWPAMIFAELTFIPVAVSLVLAWNIFTQIGRDNSFCHKNALRLRCISRLALADTAAYFIALIAVFVLAGEEYRMMLLFFGIIVMGFCFTVAAAALSHLTEKAASLKDENDLTI